MNNTRYFMRVMTVAMASVAIAAIIFTVVSWSNVSNVAAQSAAPTAPLARTITVVGLGEIKIKPDVARANIGVETVQPTVQKASNENKKQIEAVITALVKQGVDRKDIQTSGLNIWAERVPGDGPKATPSTIYHMNNTVMVKLRNLDTVGETLDAAIAAGANNMYGVEYSLENPGALESEARKAAIEDAEAKAQELAELNGVAVGDVISVSEVIGSGSYYSGDLLQAAYGMGGGGGGVPVSPGELKVTMQVEITYEIVAQ